MNDFNLNTNTKIPSGFKVPENYFENFSDRLMQQLPKEEVTVISFWSKNKHWIYSAAAVLVLAIVISLTYLLKNNQETVSASEIENYIATNSTLTDEEIAEVLACEFTEIKKVESPSSEEEKAIEEALVNNPNLENYITD